MPPDTRNNEENRPTMEQEVHIAGIVVFVRPEHLASGVK